MFEHVDASDANEPNMTPLASPPSRTLASQPTDRTPASDAGVATLASVTATADDLDYTLTVGQALEQIAAARRKPPSGRSMQRYCIEGRLTAKKIRTVFGSEWLINENSLARFIESEPIVASVAGVADVPELASLATPVQEETRFPLADMTVASDAGDATRSSVATPEGERRTLASVLIENARLLAQVEGRDAIITELKEDRAFLREEVREGRRTRDDVKGIAERMLDTLRSMAIGRSVSVPNPSPDPIRATVIMPEHRRDQEGDNLT